MPFLSLWSYSAALIESGKILDPRKVEFHNVPVFVRRAVFDVAEEMDRPYVDPRPHLISSLSGVKRFEAFTGEVPHVTLHEGQEVLAEVIRMLFFLDRTAFYIPFSPFPDSTFVSTYLLSYFSTTRK